MNFVEHVGGCYMGEAFAGTKRHRIEVSHRQDQRQAEANHEH